MLIDSTLDIETSFLSLPTQDLVKNNELKSEVRSASSAVALTGILATNLIVTICEKSIQSSNYLSYHYKCKEMLEESIKIDRKLKNYIDKDAKLTTETKKLIETKNMTLAKSQINLLQKNILQCQKLSIQTPLDIATCCIEISNYGMSLFDFGEEPSRADAATAASLGIAGAQGALSVISLNLLSFRRSVWLTNKKDEANELGIKIQLQQEKLNLQLTKLLNQS